MHALVVADAWSSCGGKLDGFIDPTTRHWPSAHGPAYWGDDSLLLGREPSSVRLLNGIGLVSLESIRLRLSEMYLQSGFAFATVRHSSAIVADTASISPGAQILSGAIVNALATIGSGSIINSGSVVEHHVHVGDDCHISPNATLCGDVRIGDETIIGAGAVVLPTVRVGRRVIVGAGAVVTADVSDGLTVIGTPARSVRHHSGAQNGDVEDH